MRTRLPRSIGPSVVIASDFTAAQREGLDREGWALPRPDMGVEGARGPDGVRLYNAALIDPRQ